jgi:UDP-GlcNAc:undecaprenyl-phosphate/decaprenyl-phosphate GlcNAc-1-phosphate transferase
MKTFYLELLVAVLLMAVQLPLLIQLFVKLRLLDEPDERKKHKKAIPAIGGLALGITMIELTFFFPSIRNFWFEHYALSIPLIALLITGVWDDQRNLSSGFRFLIQISCSVFLVLNDVTIGNLGGLLGFQELPAWFDAVLTIVTVTGVTNAFNLIDGIDGLAGGMAFMNLSILGLIGFLSNNQGLLIVTCTWALMVLVFLYFNWSPAKVFMGDGGSLVFGFFFIGMGLTFRKEIPELPWLTPATSLAILSALLIVPVTDTLRVFAFRISQGRSPYSADRNHLHHWIIRNRIAHKIATLRILLLHASILPVTMFLVINEFSLLSILLIQFFIVLGYTKMIHTITNFNRWYRFIRRYEMNDSGYTA